LEVLCDDVLFDHPLMTSTSVDELSLNSSASAQLAAFYKDTQQCILLLKTRLGELGEDGAPPRRQVEAPALLPQSKRVVVARCREHRLSFPAFHFFGSKWKEWVN
jgi:hypothetical protein